MAKTIEYSCDCGIRMNVPLNYAGMTIQCHNCGKIIELNPADCQQNVSAAPTICSGCGAANLTGSSRCLHCGQQISRKNPLPGVVLLLIILVIGFLLGWFLCPGYLGIVPPGYRAFPEYFAQPYPRLGKWYTSLRGILSKVPASLLRDQQRMGTEVLVLIHQLEEYSHEVADLDAAVQDLTKQKLEAVKRWQQKSNHNYVRQLYFFMRRRRLELDVAPELKQLKQAVDKIAVSDRQLQLQAIADALQKNR